MLFWNNHDSISASVLSANLIWETFSAFVSSPKKLGIPGF